MARKILNLPEELSDEQKAKLLNKDIPYRVELLRMVSKIPLPASQLTEGRSGSRADNWKTTDGVLGSGN